MSEVSGDEGIGSCRDNIISDSASPFISSFVPLTCLRGAFPPVDLRAVCCRTIKNQVSCHGNKKPLLVVTVEMFTLVRAMIIVLFC